MRPRPPALAEWLLEHSGLSDELIGDVQEAFMAHPSRLWYWHQVAAALLIVVVRGGVRRNGWRTLRRLVAVGVVIPVAIYAVACGPKVGVAEGLEVEALTSGWVELAGAGGPTKIVPAISFRLKNISHEALQVLQVNAVFRRGRETDEWGNAFQTAAGSVGLAPGTTTRNLLLRSQQGYTGTDAAISLLENSHFIDARVDLFGRYASTPWIKLGEYPIVRTLIKDR